MKVLAHRGDWESREDRNSPEALARALTAGFGIETDVRDSLGTLVISHDPPTGDEQKLDELLGVARSTGAPLALNIKADGLARSVRAAVDAAGAMQDAFVFDMSVPDMRGYFDAGVRVFARLSEVEHEPAWGERCAGYWLDAFEEIWYSADDVARLLDSGRQVCVVSPELHSREHGALWELISGLAGSDDLMLCTDLPHEAKRAFG